MKREPTESDYERFLNRLRAKDPQWKEHEELGTLLRIHINDFTPEQRKRYD